jgi:hypothetical protein
VEFSTGVALFQYLFKYFFKPPDHANWTIYKQPDATADSTPSHSTGRKPVDEIRDYERGRYLSSIEAATRLVSFHISEKHPGVKRLPIHLPGRQHAQMSRKDGSESDSTLLVRYMTRPRHPELDNMTYVEFGSKCRLEKHDPEQEIHPLQILEDEYPGRPRMRIRFYKLGHVGVSRIQMVYNGQPVMMTPPARSEQAFGDGAWLYFPLFPLLFSLSLHPRLHHPFISVSILRLLPSFPLGESG